MHNASIDFETYSEAGYVWAGKWEALPGASQGKKGLQVVGTSVYSEHPSTEVLTMSYDLGDGSRNWQPGALPPVALFAHIRRGGLVKAWNTRFEYLIWNNVCVPKYGWPPLPLNQLRDTMAKSRAHALPGALGKAADVLGLTEQKDGDGGRLIKKFSMPRNPTKKDPRTRIRLMSEPVDGPLMLAYCDQDVRAEAAADAVIPDLSAAETGVWLLDQEINDRGVMLDMGGVQNCIAVIEQAHAQYNAELRTLTGGTVSRASELQKLTGWLGAQGVHTESLDEEHLTELLRAPELLPPQARRALEIRAAIGSAAVKKVFAMRNAVSRDGRLRDLYLYHGARTGRVTGAGAQPTNMPNSAGVYATRCEACERHYGAGVKDCPWCGCTGDLSHQVEWGVPAAQDALGVIGTQNLNAVEHFYGDAMQAVSGCLRSLFVAAPGHDLICSDYSSIEAVVLAMLSGEQWRIDVFRTHGKIYEMSAAKIAGVSFEAMLEHKKTTGQHHPLRKLGKVAELASGYQGWIGSWVQFGADEFLSEEEIKTAILAWRAASPAIVELWGGQERNWQPELFGVEGAFITAMHHPGQEFFVRGLRFQKRGDAVYIRLPSGRELTYHRPRLGPSDRRPGTHAISFEGWNSNPLNGAVGWITLRTWGGRLVENCIAEGTLVLTRRGWVRIESILDSDEVHDGVDFVRHRGLISKSVQPCVAVDGVWMTEDHEVLTDDGWHAAKAKPRPFRPEIRDAHRVGAWESSRPEAFLDFSVRVWRNLRKSGNRSSQGGKTGANPKLRMCCETNPGLKNENARDEPPPSVRGLARDERSVPSPVASGLGELWGEGHRGLRRVASVFRGFLVEHGANVLRGLGLRSDRQQQALLTGELPLDFPSEQCDEPENDHSDGRCPGIVKSDGHRGNDTLLSSGARVAGRVSDDAARPQKQVFDILNCGPQHRFVVRGETGPFIVHNCVQAIARDIQWHGLLALRAAGYPTVLHVYDEDVCEVPEGFGSVEELEEIMGRMPEWAADWPIRAQGGWRGKRYRK